MQTTGQQRPYGFWNMVRMSSIFAIKCRLFSIGIHQYLLKWGFNRLVFRNVPTAVCDRNTNIIFSMQCSARGAGSTYAVIGVLIYPGWKEIPNVLFYILIFEYKILSLLFYIQLLYIPWIIFVLLQYWPLSFIPFGKHFSNMLWPNYKKHLYHTTKYVILITEKRVTVHNCSWYT